MTLEASGLVVLRAGGRRVLDGMSCRLAPGRLTGIIGPNGAGKSTLMETLAGLLVPASGEVRLGARALAAIPPAERARTIAWLPQSRLVHWPMSVERIVALGRLPHRAGRPGDTDRDRGAIRDAIAAMDLAHLAGRPADRLSGGELARVLVARALAQETPVLLADEPVAGLDPAHALALLGRLARIAREGRTVAVALHDLSMARRFCDDAIVLAEGRVVAAGPVAEVLVPERLEPVFDVRLVAGEVGGMPVVLPAGPRH